MLYWESQVLIEPVGGDRIEDLERIVRAHDFRVLDLLASRDPITLQTFCVGRDEDPRELSRRMNDLMVALLLSGFNVWRGKVSVVTWDEEIKVLSYKKSKPTPTAA